MVSGLFTRYIFTSLTNDDNAVFPALAIFLTVLAFNLLGDGLRDALDPNQGISLYEALKGRNLNPDGIETMAYKRSTLNSPSGWRPLTVASVERLIAPPSD